VVSTPEESKNLGNKKLNNSNLSACGTGGMLHEFLPNQCVAEIIMS